MSAIRRDHGLGEAEIRAGRTAGDWDFSFGGGPGCRRRGAGDGDMTSRTIGFPWALTGTLCVLATALVQDPGLRPEAVGRVVTRGVDVVARIWLRAWHEPETARVQPASVWIDSAVPPWPRLWFFAPAFDPEGCFDVQPRTLAATSANIKQACQISAMPGGVGACFADGGKLFSLLSDAGRCPSIHFPDPLSPS